MNTEITKINRLALSRRALLQAGVLTAIGLLGVNRIPGAGSEDLARHIADLGKQPGVEQIARIYLQRYPDHSEVFLSEWLANSIGSKQFDAEIATLFKNDFENGRTLLVDDWLLAETEARFCTLAYLLSA